MATRGTAFAAVAALGFVCALDGAAQVTPEYKRASAGVEARVADLLSRMSVDEKVAELSSGLRPRQSVDQLNASQRSAITGSRLGIPILFFESAGSVELPQPLALAASWDPALMREVHAMVAQQARSQGSRLANGPALELARDPRRGHIAQTFGEDPYLVGEMGVAAVEGLQGTMARALAADKVFAALTHWAGEGVPAEGSEAVMGPLSQRELREYFFPPFEAAIQRAGAAVVVAARNEIDGVPSHSSKWLLQEVLRSEWSFGGAILAAPGAIGELESIHHVAANPADAARLALQAGVDADPSGGPAFATLADAVRAGRIPQSRLDAAAGRVLALKFRAGLFEKPYAEAPNAAARDRESRSRTVALKAAQRSITLLKNDGALPWVLPAAGRAPSKIAVIELGEGSLGEALRAKARGRANVVIARDRNAALDAARAAERVVLAIGEGPASDREAWLDALKALGKPVVVVLATNRPEVTIRIAEQANALVGAWALGAQGSRAVADVLVGDVNPGGKLPVTIARNPGQWPLFYNAKSSARRGYLFDTTDPLYPFGWGLSYSTFEIGAPRLAKASIAPDGSVEVAVDVRNTGSRAGDETVQLYVRDKLGSVTRPMKALKGFQRVTLAAGERRTLTFTLTPKSLEMWDERMKRVVEPGEFDVMAGANSTQLQSATLTVAGRAAK